MASPKLRNTVSAESWHPPLSCILIGLSSILAQAVTCHFYLLLFPLLDLCSTSRYFHYFCLLSSVLILHPIIFQIHFVFHLPLILHFIICLLPYSIFHLYVSLLCFYYYLSIICPLFLAFPFQPWQLNIPFLVTLWIIFYILHTTLFAVLLQVL